MSSPFDKEHYNPLDTYAFEQITVAATAIGFTSATFNTTTAMAKSASVNIEAAQVRYRMDGTDPTATVGTILEAGDELIVWGTMDINSIRFIRTGGVSGILNVHYAE